MTRPHGKAKHKRAKIAPPLRSFSLGLRRRLNQAEEVISKNRTRRTTDIYLRALRTFMVFEREIEREMEKENFFIHGDCFRRYCVYLKARRVGIYSKLSHLLDALNAAFSGHFDEEELRTLCRHYRPGVKAGRRDVFTLAKDTLAEEEQEFVSFVEEECGYHRSDTYLRFLGHLKRFSPGILDVDYRKRFLQPAFEPILEAWLDTVSDAKTIKGFHFVGEELDAWLGGSSYSWIRPVILLRVAALAPTKKKPTSQNRPAILSRSAASGGPMVLKVAADMRVSPLFNLMEEIAPTHRSPIRLSRRFPAIRDTSRRTLDQDILHLINARIERSVGSPEDPAREIFSLPSLMALTDHLQKLEMDPRTIGRMLGRIRWLRKRVHPFDDDHGTLYLSVVGRHHFQLRRPTRRRVSHINYVGLTERLQAFLGEVECGLRQGIGRHSLRKVEWRDLLIVGLMLSTGIRLKNAHGLRSHWIRLGPAPCLSIPAGQAKNGRDHVCPLPEWLVASLRAYSPDIGNLAKPDFPVWRSRDTASLSRASVERSIRKTSLCLVQESLQPHDYRRLYCVFVQDSDDIDQTKAHLLTGHRDPETLYSGYGSETIPDYLDGVMAPFRESQQEAGWWG